MTDKGCPRLQKFYIPETGKLEQWQIDICDFCIGKDICYEDPRSVLIKILRDSQIPCPKCQAPKEMSRQARKRIANEIHAGDRMSTLQLNDDKDWECFICHKIIYQLKRRRACAS